MKSYIMDGWIKGKFGEIVEISGNLVSFGLANENAFHICLYV